MQMRKKRGKSRITVFFQWFVAPEGRKVGSLKRRVRSHLARWEMKSCTPLWRKAHVEVKMYKTHHSWTTFGSWDVEKVHAVVARSTFASEKANWTMVGPRASRCIGTQMCYVVVWFADAKDLHEYVHENVSWDHVNMFIARRCQDKRM